MDGSLQISKGLQNLIISAKGLFSISLTYINESIFKITSLFKSVPTD